MPRLRKSKSSGDLSAFAPTFPAGLFQRLTSQRDSKALALSSASIALSVGSAFSSTPGISGDVATSRETVTGWQTAYAAARMAVEITKESSDMFLPLKAAVGAVSVLVQNYDQTVDNVKSVKDIERRVQSLSGVLASPVHEDDYAEKGRRVELQRKLEGVIAKLQPLSEQHALLSFLRNVDNAKTLTGFIQELADAITDYQVSIQQGVYERTWNIQDETQNIREETRDIQENTRNLISDTKNIQDDTKNILEASELEILEKLEPVRNAGYQRGHHDKCLPGTRESVLRGILLWAKSPQHQNVFWLNGLAGTGKSTIAQSITETVANDGFLGASFFCSRDYIDRRELKNIFPTLAYQLACRYPGFRKRIVGLIKKDPAIAHTSLISQLEDLLAKPLSEENISCTIVIDALDECIDDQPASAILSVLGRLVQGLPSVKFFITGRPEPRIRTGFRLPLLEPLTQIFLLHEVKSEQVDKDIRLYLTQRLTAIAKRRSDIELPDPWPREDEIVALTKKSSGLFIFASTIVRFIESEHHEPTERLKLILPEASGTTHEGRAGIDFLYTQILLHIFSDIHESEVFVNLRRVLGAIIHAFNPLSRRQLATILGSSTSSILTTLRHLHSVVLVPDDENAKIRVFHKSFPDFLQDGNRCTDPRFHIDSVVYHGDMALSCLGLVKNPERNPCCLPPFIMNRDVHELPELLESRLGGGVRYACSYWVGHLRLSRPSNLVISSATEMLESPAPWIEVMSLENLLGEVIRSMSNLLDWLDNTERRREVMYELATDCLHLTMDFFQPIQQCAQQIYHTALPLSPTSSLLRSNYLRNTTGDQISQTNVFLGAPRSWGLLLTTINLGQGRLTCIAAIAQRIIAASEDMVNIYDAVTFTLEQSLHAPQSVTKIQSSRDGSILYLVHSCSVTSWDIQTGGLLDTFIARSEISDIAVSPTGDHIACGSPDGSVTFWNIHTKKKSNLGAGQPLVAIHWLSSVELMITTQDFAYTAHVTAVKINDSFRPPGPMWGVVILDSEEVLVGTSRRDAKGGQTWCFFRTIAYGRSQLRRAKTIVGSREEVWDKRIERRSRDKDYAEDVTLGPLKYPTRIGDKVACVGQPSGVRVFSIGDDRWTNKPSLLDAAKSVAVSLNRNLVVQTEHSAQIFSIEVLASNETRNDVHPSRIYPLGENHIVCLQQNRHLTILGLETLQELRPGDPTSSPQSRSSLPNQLASTRVSLSRGLVAEYGVSTIVQTWQTNTPLPGWAEAAEEDALLGRSSPEGTRVATVYRPLQGKLRVKDATKGTVLAELPLEDADLGPAAIYDLTFDSETRLYLNIGGPQCHVQVPYDIIASPSGRHPCKIERGEPVPLSEPWRTPPYTLDANCEWVLDQRSRKICWIPPESMRRGDGGYFWAGLSLVMLGDDGAVRKLSFKAPIVEE